MVMAGRLHRYYHLTRYYVNLWKYDSEKWAERVWYGVGASDTKNTIASVPFMITRAMRMDLEKQGFPSESISKLSPVIAHEIIKEKLAYVEFLAREIKQKEQADNQDQVDNQTAGINNTTTSTSSSSALVIHEVEEEQQQEDSCEKHEKEPSSHQLAVVQQTTDKSQKYE